MENRVMTFPLGVDNLVVSTIIPGSLSQAEFDILLSMTSITSEKLIEALKNHTVLGHGTVTSYQLEGISQQAFERGFKVLNTVFRKNETLWELRCFTTVNRSDLTSSIQRQEGSKP